MGLDQKQQFSVDELKSNQIKPELSENLSSYNVQTTVSQEKEGIFTGKERREDKAKPILDASKQLSVGLVNPLESVDKFSADKIAATNIDKQLIQASAIQTAQVFSNSKEQPFSSTPAKSDQSQVDLVESQALCAIETQLNDKEQHLSKLKSKSETVTYNFEKNRNLSVQETLILQNDQTLGKDLKPKSNKADLQLQSNQALQSSETLTNEKENSKDFKKKLKTKRLTPLISTREAIIIKQVESKDSKIDFEKGKLESENISPVIDTLEPLQISKPNSMESLKKHKKTVKVAEQADFTFLENINVEIGVVKSASTIEPFILEKKDLSTRGEFNLADKKAIQEHKSLILEKEQHLRSDKAQPSNASKDLQVDNAVIVSLNERIDSSSKFEEKKAKRSKASRELSESRLKLVEIKHLQVGGSVENIKQDLVQDKASVNLNERLTVQVSDDRHLEKESELTLPKVRRKSIKDKRILLKGRSLSVERNLVLNKEQLFDLPKVSPAQADHQLIFSNLIEQQAHETLQSAQDFTTKPFKLKKASVSLSNLHSLQIDLAKCAESEKDLRPEQIQSDKVLPISIGGVLNAVGSQTVLTDYKSKPSGKSFLKNKPFNFVARF